MIYLQSSLGLLLFMGLSFLLSEDRRAVPWKKVLAGLGFGLLLITVLTKLSWVAAFFLWLNKGVGVLDAVTQRASAFIFGYLGGGRSPI